MKFEQFMEQWEKIMEKDYFVRINLISLPNLYIYADDYEKSKNGVTLMFKDEYIGAIPLRYIEKLV